MKAEEQVKATYLNQVKVYLRMLEKASIELNKLWMEDHKNLIDLNDFLAQLYPFGDSFDELTDAIHIWVDDYVEKIKVYDIPRPFVVTAQRICDLNQLNGIDHDCLEEITEPYHVNARNAEEALDAYHNNVPIKVLDDFEITVNEYGHG